eukprot:TRINITY_DN3896_c0_g1_i1.p1 TRINITY_DN3896_c0_g1~~TRINITY_DN3896_c0_g1_i1.p1  ORF type:complete len:574 (-),score=148.76 TRINITY_DN3896_c0_g1_i1:17-1738(-)
MTMSHMNGEMLLHMLQQKEYEIQNLDFKIREANEILYNLKIKVHDLESRSNLYSSRAAFQESISSVYSLLEQDDIIQDPLIEQLENEVGVLEQSLTMLKKLVADSQRQNNVLSESITAEELAIQNQISHSSEKKEHLFHDLEASTRKIDAIQQELTELNDSLNSKSNEYNQIMNEINAFESSLKNISSQNNHIKSEIKELQRKKESLEDFDISDMKSLVDEKKRVLQEVTAEFEEIEKLEKSTNEECLRLESQIASTDLELKSYQEILEDRLSLLNESTTLNQQLLNEIEISRDERNRKSNDRLQASLVYNNETDQLTQLTAEIRSQIIEDISEYKRESSALNEDIRILDNKRAEILQQLLSLNEKNSSLLKKSSSFNDLREEIELVSQAISDAEAELKTISSEDPGLSERDDLERDISNLEMELDKIKRENDHLTGSINADLNGNSSIMNEISDQLSNFESLLNIPESNLSLKQRLENVHYAIQNRNQGIALRNYKPEDRVIFKSNAKFGGTFEVLGFDSYYFLTPDTIDTKGKSFFEAKIFFIDDLEAEVNNNPHSLPIGTQYHHVFAEML